MPENESINQTMEPESGAEPVSEQLPEGGGSEPKKPKKSSKSKTKPTSAGGDPQAKSAGHNPTLIYLGPNIPGGMLLNGAVFCAGLPPHLDELLKDVPEVGQLCVSIDDAVKYRQLLERKGSEPSRLYQSISRKTRANQIGGES